MDIISAIATPGGVGGVAIIRLSGAGCLNVAKKMFRPIGKTSVENFKPNFMYAGNIECDGFSDFGMCVYFKSPKSFTGEDVIEFHCHGGVQIAHGVLAKTIRLGARIADKGEFTKRAFINGKLSLSSAEGMIDMINAESLATLKAGSMLYNEKLCNEVKSIQEKLTYILAQIAADIDYPEEDVEGINAEKIKTDILLLTERLKGLASTFSVGKKIKNGVSVAICGKPNAGKSCVLNSILGYDRAIVSSKAGTTRDAVEGSLEINGVKYNFIDTAGIRERGGAIENLGIEIAKKVISSSDIVLSVSDGRGDIKLENVNGKVIKVFNKCDICKPDKNYDIVISAKTGEGVDKLKELISKSSVGELTYDRAYIIEERHFEALNRGVESLMSAAKNINNYTPDILAIDLKAGWDALGEITGESANESIINMVFEKFCVGK